MTHDELTSAERQALACERLRERIRAGMKAMLEEVLEKEMTEHLHRRNSCDGYREKTPGRRGGRLWERSSAATWVARIYELRLAGNGSAPRQTALELFRARGEESER